MPCASSSDPDPQGADGNAPFEKTEKEEIPCEEMHFLGICQ